MGSLTKIVASMAAKKGSLSANTVSRILTNKCIARHSVVIFAARRKESIVEDYFKIKFAAKKDPAIRNAQTKRLLSYIPVEMSPSSKIF